MWRIGGALITGSTHTLREDFDGVDTIIAAKKFLNWIAVINVMPSRAEHSVIRIGTTVAGKYFYSLLFRMNGEYLPCRIIG